MIYDEMANIARYRGISKALDALIDWLGSHDYRELPLGRTDIDGDHAFANVQETSTRKLEDARFEVHRRYMDVQVDLDGREAFRVGQGATSNESFDEGKDFGLLDAADYVEGNLDHGRMAIYLVGEPHMPNLVYPGDGVRALRKICFKVEADER